MEIYSPVRVTTLTKELCLEAGGAMYLQTGWDFRRKEDRQRAWARIRETKPFLNCRKPDVQNVLPAQCLTPWIDARRAELDEAIEHIKFMV